MADKFDPYREALIVETDTVWPEDYDDWESVERQRVAEALHVRVHTGFCRQITVTPDDLDRVMAG